VSNTAIIGAVDTGGTNIAAGVVASEGHVLYRMEAPTNPSGEYGEACHRIASMLRESSRAAGVEMHGIGIGSTDPFLCAANFI
jgi:glucokinase